MVYNTEKTTEQRELELMDASTGMVIKVGVILALFQDSWDLEAPIAVGCLAKEVEELLEYIELGHNSLNIAMEDNATSIAELSKPDLNVILAKLVRYSSNIFSCSFMYRSTILENGMDHDIRLLLLFVEYLIDEFKLEITNSNTT